VTDGNSYFRIDRGDRDPEELLDPAKQTSEPWGGTIYGRCDKCGGSGETLHECEACKAKERPDSSCPACHGELRYRDECPTCEGTGEIDDSQREGVSVLPTLDGLYRYFAKRNAHLDGAVVIELEGTASDDEDFDADEGALLVHPTRIVRRHPLDRKRADRHSV
jgi:hypothetical protein